MLETNSDQCPVYMYNIYTVCVCCLFPQSVKSMPSCYVSSYNCTLHIIDLHMYLFVFSCGLHLVNPVFAVLPLYPTCVPWVGAGRGDITKMDDAVTVRWCLSQCKHFLLLYYHYHGWCYCYNSHFRKRLSCWDRKAEKLNGKRRHWNSGGEYELYNIYIYR